MIYYDVVWAQSPLFYYFLEIIFQFLEYWSFLLRQKKLFVIILTLNYFSKNATRAPEIGSCLVFLLLQNDLWRPVESCA